MHQVLSIQTSRAFGEEKEYVSKRLCCSFLISVGFLTILGGFLLGRFSTYRDMEIKKSQMEYQRSVLYSKHASYLEALDQFSDALLNLTTTQDTQPMDEVKLVDLWKILACKSAHAALEAKRNSGSDFKYGMEVNFKIYLDMLTECIQQGVAYIQNVS